MDEWIPGEETQMAKTTDENVKIRVAFPNAFMCNNDKRSDLKTAYTLPKEDKRPSEEKIDAIRRDFYN